MHFTSELATKIQRKHDGGIMVGNCEDFMFTSKALCIVVLLVIW